MGYDAAIWVYDHHAFTDEIAPVWARSYAARRILPELRTLMEQRGWGSSITFIEPEDAENDEQRYGLWNFWRERCLTPDSPRCTLLTARQLAISQGQFLGRSFTYMPFVNALLKYCDLPYQSRLQELIEALNTRGREGPICDNCRPDDPEGVAGWLDPVETEEFAELLDQLDLPRYERSFATMEAAWRESLNWNWEGDQRNESGRRWVLLGLSFMRTAAQIAVSEGRGVLWGNDIRIGGYWW